MIKPLNDTIGFRVLTTNGIKNIDSLNFGDKLYEYKTNNLLEVVKVRRYPISQSIFIVKYSDGRKFIYGPNDLIFNGYRIIKFEDLFDNINRSSPIIQYPIDYKKLLNPLDPDPYVAGALLLYGNFDIPFINLPISKSKADNLFFNKYNMVFGENIRGGVVYFKYEHTDELIRWDDFFKRYKVYVNGKHIDDPLIPEEYIYSSINDRWQFIRGVFDLGYNEKDFADRIGIASNYKYKLKEIQKILWSLGLLSNIVYDPYITDKSTKYRLEIRASKHEYPGLFYDINNMEYNISKETAFINHMHKFDVTIKSIECCGFGYIYNVEFKDSKNALYLTDNFLPKVSL